MGQDAGTGNRQGTRQMVPLTDRILDHFPDPTVLLDGRRSVIYANGAARELLDITRVGQDLAMSLRHPRVLGAVDQVLGRGETRTVEVILPGNTTRNFEMYVAGVPPAPDIKGVGAVLPCSASLNPWKAPPAATRTPASGFLASCCARPSAWPC